MRVQLRFVEVLYFRLQPGLLLGLVEGVHELRHQVIEGGVSDETHVFDLAHLERLLHLLHSVGLYKVQLSVLHFLQLSIDLFFLQQGLENCSACETDKYEIRKEQEFGAGEEEVDGDEAGEEKQAETEFEGIPIDLSDEQFLWLFIINCVWIKRRITGAILRHHINPQRVSHIIQQYRLHAQRRAAQIQYDLADGGACDVEKLSVGRITRG